MIGRGSIVTQPRTYFLGGLLSRPPPDGLPVVLGLPPGPLPPEPPPLFPPPLFPLAMMASFPTPPPTPPRASRCGVVRFP